MKTTQGLLRHGRKELVSMKLRLKKAFLATKEQLDAVVGIARGSRMDESWFGEIAEGKTVDGKRTHVVYDRERGYWMSLKYAVKTMDEGIVSARDYLDDPKEVHAYEKLLVDLGIVSEADEKASGWYVRVASEDKKKIVSLVKAMLDEDIEKQRFRPMNTRKTKDGKVYYTDLGDCGSWGRSMCLWFCLHNDIGFDVCFHGPKRSFHHVVYNGMCVLLAETVQQVTPFVEAHDIIETQRKERRNENC